MKKSLKIKEYIINRVLVAVYIICSASIVIHMNNLVTSTPTQGDATQNVRLAYHLYTEGSLAVLLDRPGVPLPSNYREPVPPIVSAIYMYLHPDITKDATLDSFKKGANTARIKKVNLFWIFLLLIGVGLLTYAITRNRFLPFLSFGLVVYYFVRFGNNFDLLYTEIQAATMIVWTSYFFHLAFKKDKQRYHFLAGLLYGLLVLTKSVFFYLLPVILFLLFILQKKEKKARKLAVLFGGAALVLAPWLIRNVILLNDFGVTQRGGGVLYNRALQNNMKPEEAKAAIYLWGPELYRELVEETSLSVDSLDLKGGGQYEEIVRYPDSKQDLLAFERIRPSMAVSYHSKVIIDKDSTAVSLRSKGMNREEARAIAFNLQKEKAIDLILENPVNHLRMTPLFFWRGIWCFPNSTIPFVSEQFQTIFNNFVNLFSYLAMFLLFIYSIIKRDEYLLALTIVPIFLILFQGSIAHNIPRYTEPAIPSMVISLVIAGAIFAEKAGHKYDIKLIKGLGTKKY